MIEGEGAGKGDTYRPVDREKFNQNFADIDWRKKEQCPECGLERDPSYHSCWNCGHSFDP